MANNNWTNQSQNISLVRLRCQKMRRYSCKTVRRDSRKLTLIMKTVTNKWQHNNYLKYCVRFARPIFRMICGRMLCSTIKTESNTTNFMNFSSLRPKNIIQNPQMKRKTMMIQLYLCSYIVVILSIAFAWRSGFAIKRCVLCVRQNLIALEEMIISKMIMCRIMNKEVQLQVTMNLLGVNRIHPIMNQLVMRSIAIKNLLHKIRSGKWVQQLSTGPTDHYGQRSLIQNHLNCLLNKSNKTETLQQGINIIPIMGG